MIVSDVRRVVDRVRDDPRTTHLVAELAYGS